MQNDPKEALLKLVHDALEKDKALRETYKTGEKFRFIRDRLHALAAHVEEDIRKIEASVKKPRVLSKEEAPVYVYLFNAQGAVLSTWQKMLNPSVLYEYSVNRPIYANQADIEYLIRGKPNKAQHAYLTIMVLQSDILAQAENKEKQPLSLVKVKEGALRYDKILFFNHNGLQYEVDNGQLTIKS